jgi:hypothetical protein
MNRSKLDELEKTDILKILFDKDDEEEELSIIEIIEEFEEKLEYKNIDEKKKKSILKLINDIKADPDEKVQEFLFKELVKMVEE